MSTDTQHELGAEAVYLTQGGADAVAKLFDRHRQRLQTMIQFRLDNRLTGRIDAEDILQEAFLEVSRRIDDYLQNPSVSFFVWARKITWQILIASHRRHLEVQKRSANQEARLFFAGAASSSRSIAWQLAASLTSPSEAAIRQELITRLRTALDALEERDREVLVMRHFEQLSNTEVAQTLGLSKTAASNRYVRAIRRLKTLLE